MYEFKSMNTKQFGGKVFLAPFQAHVYFQSNVGFSGKKIPVLLNGSAPAQVVHIPTNTARFIAGLNNIIPRINQVTDAIYEASLDENVLDDLLTVSLPHFVVSEDTLTGVKHCFPIFGGNTVEGTVSHILAGLRDLTGKDEIKPREAVLISELMPDALLKMGKLYNGLTRVDNSYLDSFLYETVMPEAPKNGSASFDIYDMAWKLFPDTFKGNYFKLSTHIRNALIELQDKAILEEMFA